MDKPQCVDLYAGLGGWSEGFLAEGYECIGVDNEVHEYGDERYPGMLIVRDVRSIHGSEFKDATCIVGSSPCQQFSYRAMPWSRAKALPPPYLGIELFNAQFRIQREASEAAGRYIPLVVENVRGAQKWIGDARWHYGSFYLWGDVPALMPMSFQAVKTVGHANIRDGFSHTRHLTNQCDSDGIKQTGIGGLRDNGKGDGWFQNGAARHGSKSNARKEASAMIAKIPFPLAQHIAQTFYPRKMMVVHG